MTKNSNNVVHRINPTTGAAEVGIRLTNHRDMAWTSLDAYDRIAEQHGDVPWFVNYGKGRAYVRLVSKGEDQPRMVSRLVVGEKPRKVVKYRDGDRLNLRQENLMVCHGTGGMKRRAKAACSAAPLQGA